MTISEQDKLLILKSFNLLNAQPAEAAQIFYQRLFERAPNAQHLFSKADMGFQGDKLMHAFGVIVSMLDDWDELVPQIEALGRRHIGYGVLPEHYIVLQDALLDTLGFSLGAKFTPPTSAAWAKLYGDIVAVILRVYNDESDAT